VVKVDVGVQGLPLPYVVAMLVPETGGSGIPVHVAVIALGGIVVLGGVAVELVRRRSR
jgi:hypothetical protein